MKNTRNSSTAVASKPRPSSAPAKPKALTYDEIALRAFLIWESKGKPIGQDAANWRAAEQQLKLERGIR